MAEKYKRNIVTHLNKYQKKIIWPVLVACLVACVSTLLCIVYIYYPDDYTLFDNFGLKKLKFIIPWVLLVTSMMLLVVIFWTYHMSNKLVGPYERIMKNLDALLSGEKKDSLYARKGDEMFEDLIDRINRLIEKKS